MTCLFCNEKMVEGFGTYVNETNDGMVIIKHVPCMKCPQCDYTVYNKEILKELDGIVHKHDLNASKIVVENFSSSKVA